MPWNWVDTIQKLQKEHKRFAVATLINTEKSVPQAIGARMIVESTHEGAKIYGTIGGGGLEKQVIEDAMKLIQDKKSRTIHYHLDEANDMLCGGKAEVFIESINEGPKLYIFGAGHVGQALCRVLHDSPFTLHLIDEREEWINHPSLPDSVLKYHSRWEEAISKIDWNKEKSFIVIMTHGHKHDYQILENILNKDYRYLGLMGSANKWGEFKEKLKAKGIDNSSKVTCPIGNKKLGPGPTEIAIGIANEVLMLVGDNRL